MAGKVGGAIQGVPKLVNEAMVKPTGNELGQIMVEAGQSLQGYPQSQTQKPPPQGQSPEAKQKEQIRKQNVLRFIQQVQANEQRLKQQKLEEQQKKQQEQKAEDDKKQKQQVKQFELKPTPSTTRTDVFQSQRKTEIKIKRG